MHVTLSPSRVAAASAPVAKPLSVAAAVAAVLDRAASRALYAPFTDFDSVTLSVTAAHRPQRRLPDTVPYVIRHGRKAAPVYGIRVIANRDLITDRLHFKPLSRLAVVERLIAEHGKRITFP